MAAINYGTIAVIPKGIWDSAAQYNVANLVTYDGSSYLAHTVPPVGTVPTDTTYWQVSAQGTNTASADAIGVVKPDGETITVDSGGTISAKKATESTFGIVGGGSNGVTVGSDGVMGVDTTFTQATELANIIAAEAFSTVLGKVSKAIAMTMSLDENALLKNMLSSVDVNDAEKIPTSAYIHKLVERIGMGTDLDSGDSLTAAVNSLNSDLDNTDNKLATAQTDISTLKGLLNNGQFWVSNSSYTDITIDGVMYTGSTDIAWMNLTNGSDRRIVIGFVFTSSNGDVWTKFITTPRLLIQNVIAGTWSGIRSV